MSAKENDRLKIGDLENFVLDNPELERLEALLEEFNPFEALKLIRRESVHSQFLRWILDPHETHGLGAYFLKMFVKAIVSKDRGSVPNVPSVVDVDGWNLSGTQVITEWNKVDILVRDDRVKFVGVIENKIDSAEHGGQLQRYRQLVEREFPSYSKLFIYLTVEGDAPSDDSYISVTYSDVEQRIKELRERRADQLGSDVGEFLSQYREILRRHIVANSEIQQLSNTIYETHRRALDTIFEHREDRTLILSNHLKKQIDRHPELVLYPSSKTVVRFLPGDLDFLPKTGTGWNSGNLVMFELEVSTVVACRLMLGPGPEPHRKLMIDQIKNHPKPFSRPHSEVAPTWWSFHSEPWITKENFDSPDMENLKLKLENRMDELTRIKIPMMIEAFGALKGVEWPSGGS